MIADPISYATAGVAVRVVTLLLKPTLEKFRDRLSTKADLVIDLLTNSFSEYLERSYEKFKYLPTIVFPNQKKLLKSLYIPLRISAGGLTQDLYLINGYPDALFEKYKDILVVDTAGMGKSTIIKYIFLEAIEGLRGIPVIIELRKLSKTKSIVDLIYDEINGLRDSIDRRFLVDVIDRGDFVFLLDGYDEIPPEFKADVTAGLQDFKSKANNNKFVLTSRDEPGLASFSDFQRFNIQPLEEQEAFELIFKYSIDEGLANSLIAKLSDNEYASIKEFLKNPLLVSLLYKSYEYKPTVPLKKHVFYRQVYEALFENHDFSKGGEFQRKKKSGLDIDQFHSVLRALAFLTYKEGKTEFDSDELLHKIEKAKEYCTGLKFSNSDFRSDLINQVPLLIKDGNYYRWSHKSIQEYFTACFVCMDTKADEVRVFNTLYLGDKIHIFINMLMLCFDIDQKTFFRSIVRNLAEEFIKAVNEARAALGAVICDDKIIRRVELSVFKCLVFCNTSDMPPVTYDGPPSGNPLDEPFTKLHFKASDFGRKQQSRISEQSGSTWIFPTTICVCSHELSPIIEQLVNKDDVDFIVPLEGEKDFSISVSLPNDNQIVAMNLEIDSPLNSIENYEQVTNMIQQHVQWRFDFINATKFIDAMENEIRVESAGDFEF